MRKTTCDAVQPELKAYLDRCLAPLHAYRVRHHLLNCEKCRHVLAEIEQIGKELRNLETEMTTAADKLDPMLRAKILAAIPAEAPTARTRSRVPFGVRPMLALGTLVAAIFAAILILPQGPLRSKAQRVDSARDSKAPAHVLADSGATFAAPAAEPSKAENKYGKLEQTAPLQADSLVPQSSGNRAAATAAPATPSDDGVPTVTVNGSETTAGFGAIPNASKRASGYVTADAPGVAPGSALGKAGMGGGGGFGGVAGASKSKSVAVGTALRAGGRVIANAGPPLETHTYTTSSLEEGEKLVRQVVSSFQGSVAVRPVAAGSNTLEFTVTVPAARSAALLAALPDVSGGKLTAQTTPARALEMADGHPARVSLAEPQRPSSSAGSPANRPAPSSVDITDAIKATRAIGTVSDRPGVAGGGRSSKAQSSSTSPPAPEQKKITITIVLVKGK